MDGWIKIHRKILDNPIVCKDSDHFAVWSFLLLNASHKEMPALFKGKKIMLMSGQVITDRKEIVDAFNDISESKVQRILKTLENEQQIEQQTCNKNRLITIVNWNEYQDNAQESEQQNEQQLNNKRTTTEQQSKEKESNQRKSNIQELKNIKKKDIQSISQKEKAKRFIPPTVEEVESYCLERKNGINAKRFISHYETSKWYRGKTKIADWKACVRTWEQKDKQEKAKDSFLRHNYTDEQLSGAVVDFDKWEVEK